MARPVFDEELHMLRSEMIEMGELVKDAVEGSFEAVEKGNATKAYLISQNDSLIDEHERSIEQLCLRLLLCEQPVASDLRAVTAALKMITDLERIGDQATEICEIATSLPEDVSLSSFASLGAMAKLCVDQVDEAVDSFIKLDLIKARECVERDNSIDELFEETKRAITAHIIEHHPDETYLLDVLMIAKYLERIGDHAVNIAEWVEYAVTGVHNGASLAVESD